MACDYCGVGLHKTHEHYLGWDSDSLIREIELLKLKNASMLADLRMAREALEYYGDKENWKDDNTGKYIAFIYGRGDYAREALQKLERWAGEKP